MYPQIQQVTLCTQPQFWLGIREWHCTIKMPLPNIPKALNRYISQRSVETGIKSILKHYMVHTNLIPNPQRCVFWSPKPPSRSISYTYKVVRLVSEPSCVGMVPVSWLSANVLRAETCTTHYTYQQKVLNSIKGRTKALVFSARQMLLQGGWDDHIKLIFWVQYMTHPYVGRIRDSPLLQ